jgi:hypothetical protein
MVSSVMHRAPDDPRVVLFEEPGAREAAHGGGPSGGPSEQERAEPDAGIGPHWMRNRLHQHLAPQGRIRGLLDKIAQVHHVAGHRRTLRPGPRRFARTGGAHRIDVANQTLTEHRR